jgi:hypothetical protein
MSRITNNQIMEQLTAMNAMMQSIIEEQKSQRADISALQKAVSAGKTPSKKTASSKKSAPTPKTSPKSSNIDQMTPDELMKKFEPKRQDGNYHWGSYKAQRTKFVEFVSGKKDQWLPKEEYNEWAAPWVEYWGEYVKKEDRK